MSKADQLMALLRREMNGAVAEEMAARGIHYTVNFGVSTATIRQIAAAFAPDDALACELWLRPEREAILAALFIADCGVLDETRLVFWEKRVINSEVAEYLAFAQTGRSAVAWEAFVRWSESSNPLLRYCAAMTLLRLLVLRGDTTCWDMARVTTFAKACATSPDRALRSAAERLEERL